MMADFRFFAALLFLSLFLQPSRAQDASPSSFTARVLDAHEREPMRGVNVRIEGTNRGAATDGQGMVILQDVPAGPQTIVFSFVGYETVRRSLDFPLADPDHTFEILMEEEHGELEEIAVTATRTSRTIADQPTRIETIAGEEIDEKISMEPSNISMLLNESPGITVQQTSAVSGGASIRIQGLDGRYTQLLKDGFPLYGGFSGGLALLQVPPLDLAQVEIIKGPASTLYGGDAIAGLVNLVSKTPTEGSELATLVNATSAGGYDLGSFYRVRRGRVGGTVLASGNLQQAFDPDDDAFSNLPDTRRLTLHPKLFYYPSEATTVTFGIQGTFEDRKGGDMRALEEGESAAHPFIEHNTSTRLTTQLRMDHTLDTESGGPWEGGHITLKNSVSLFDRSIRVPDYRFSGLQVATYTEASLLLDRPSHDIVLGLDVRSDAFQEQGRRAAVVRDYTYTSTGVFAQDTWDASDRFVLETGLRTDYHSEFGFFTLPKVSLLIRMSEQLSSRVGGGLGYKAPTVFLEASEERAFAGVAPLGADIKAERSVGGSVDVNWNTLLFDRIGLSFNQAFYFTTLRHALVPELEDGGLTYVNAPGHIRTRALETNAKLTLGDLKLFLGYVYLDAGSVTDGARTALPLTPTHKTYTVLVWEQHGKGRIGLEAYYTGPQTLRDGRDTDGYLVTGVMAERRVGSASLFVNFENLLDEKQSNHAPVVLSSRANPQFADIWAPMDGFVINGGVKYTL